MSVATDIIQAVDTKSGTIVTYKEETKWYDGSPLDDSKIDNNIFNKQGNKFYKKQIKEETLIKLKTVSDLRITEGYYEGQEVSLLGYYESGDKTPLHYIFTVQNLDSLTDDGGSVIKTERGAWIAQFDKEINVLHFGAIKDFSDYSNTPVRKAINYIKERDGGVLYFPEGRYKFSREIITEEQNPARPYVAMYYVGNNVTIKGDGMNKSRLLFECIGQRASDLDYNLYYQFFCHQYNFTVDSIEIMGDVIGDEFEFESYRPPEFKDAGIFQAKGIADSTVCKNSSITNCRLGGTRGFIYSTSLITECRFTNNECLYGNGFNVLGNKVICDSNYWYYCELMETAAEIPYTQEAIDLGFGNNALVSFKGNNCSECVGVSVGGFYSTDIINMSFGYEISNNVFINNVVDISGSLIAVAENASHVTISNNTVKIKSGICIVTLTSETYKFGTVNITGGIYETGGTLGFSLNTGYGKIFVSNVYVKCATNPLGLTSFGTGLIVIQSGVFEGNRVLATGTATGRIVINKSAISFIAKEGIPTELDVYEIAVPIVYDPSKIIVKDGTDSNKLVEYTKISGIDGGNPKFGAMFMKLANGRMGWGDKTRTYNPNNNEENIDVYLDRKAPNTLGVDDGDSLRVGRTTTANRPDASVMGAGALMFDTTVNKFIGSDGSNWIEL